MTSNRELFILSPPHAGTTAMAKLLLSSPRVWSRADNAEGQYLPDAAPHLPSNLWSGAETPDWQALKAVWEQGRPQDSILLEKSPPIMAHARELLATWPRAFFIINMRSPYAFVASYLHQRGATEEQLRKAVSRWTVRSRMQTKNVRLLKERSLVVSYEAFTSDPGELIVSLERVFGPLSIDPHRPVRVKHYDKAPISNHNARQIERMSPAQLQLTRDLLISEAAEELAFWGYAAERVS